MSQIFLSKEKMHLLELPEIPTPCDFHFLVLYRMHSILSFAGNIRSVICIIRGICQNCTKWTVAPPSRSKKLNFSLSITSTKTSRKEKPDKDSLFFAVSCCEIFGSFILVRIKSFLLADALQWTSTMVLELLFSLLGFDKARSLPRSSVLKTPC